jgi:hypothetical protein
VSSRNGHSGRYTCEQFIAAIPGTGGIISAICDRVGCSWHTAKKYIDDHSTVLEAWEAERNRITDKARHNIIKAIHDGDVQTSKWWLQVMDEDFVPREKHEEKSDVTITVVRSDA